MKDKRTHKVPIKNIGMKCLKTNKNIFISKTILLKTLTKTIKLINVTK